MLRKVTVKRSAHGTHHIILRVAESLLHFFKKLFFFLELLGWPLGATPMFYHALQMIGEAQAALPLHFRRSCRRTHGAREYCWLLVFVKNLPQDSSESGMHCRQPSHIRVSSKHPGPQRKDRFPHGTWNSV